MSDNAGKIFSGHPSDIDENRYPRQMSQSALIGVQFIYSRNQIANRNIATEYNFAT